MYVYACLIDYVHSYLYTDISLSFLDGSFFSWFSLLLSILSKQRDSAIPGVNKSGRFTA